jgi:hypothetical protein
MGIGLLYLMSAENRRTYPEPPLSMIITGSAGLVAGAVLLVGGLIAFSILVASRREN